MPESKRQELYDMVQLACIEPYTLVDITQEGKNIEITCLTLIFIPY